MSKRSSTFSFDAVPALRRTALWAVALTLLGLAALELGARAIGHRPSVFDDDDMLCLHWDRVHASQVFALVGSSRSRAGFSAEAFFERHPDTTLANLTVAGLCPLATLAQLAKDEQFHGDVLYDVTENCLVDELREHQRAKVQYCAKNWSVGKAFGRWTRLQLEPHLAVMDPALGLSSLAQSLWSKHRLPAPDYFVTSPLRLNNIDLSKVGPELGRTRVARLLAEHKRHPPSPPAEWLREAELTERYIRTIQSRGGRVTVVRFPTSGEFGRIDQLAYPRERYWDAFARISQADFIHFQDLPTRDLPCGDQSHLDGRYSPVFTRALLDEMDKRARSRSGAAEPGIAVPQ